MEQVSLSDIELFYSNYKPDNKTLIVEGEECHHIKDVMRHKTGDQIFITNGEGKIFKVEIAELNKSRITTEIKEILTYQNKLSNIVFCVPRLKSADRFEFALEKCVELGITNFIVFESARTIAKGEKLDRWQKILLSAMKQSLRSWLPQISYTKSFKELMALQGRKIIFEQSAELKLNEYLSTVTVQSSFDKGQLTKNEFFIFGPEGGLTKEELAASSSERRVKNEEVEGDIINVKLTDNRLRSETAIITAAALINKLIN